MSKQMTHRIYQHQHDFLKDASKLRPILGIVHIENGTCYTADGFQIYAFPLDLIYKKSWIEAHCETWDDKERFEASDRYMEYDYEDESDCVNLDKIPDDYLPCGEPILSISILKYPNVKVVMQREWELIADYNPRDLWALVYKGYTNEQIGSLSPVLIGDKITIDAKKLEHALKFPPFLGVDSMSVFYHAGDRILKIAAADCEAVIMGIDESL